MDDADASAAMEDVRDGVIAKQVPEVETAIYVMPFPQQLEEGGYRCLLKVEIGVFSREVEKCNTGAESRRRGKS